MLNTHLLCEGDQNAAGCPIQALAPYLMRDTMIAGETKFWCCSLVGWHFSVLVSRFLKQIMTYSYRLA